MRPTLRQLEYVVMVQRLGRFGLAAEALNVSQPSLSAQIGAIEAELGIQLFKRDRGGVQITAKGEEFVQRATRILGEVEDLRRAVTNELPFSGRLRLGVLPSIGPYLLPKAVKRIYAQQPDLRIAVREENTLELEAGLKSGRFDAIVSTPEDHPNTIQKRLFNEALWVAVATDDPIAEKDRVSASDLPGRRLLTLDNGHRLSRIVYGLAAATDSIVSDDYEGTSLDSILLMAATAAGVAVIPQLYATQQGQYRDEVTIRPLALRDANRDIALLFRSDEVLHDGHELLIDTLRKVSEELGLPTN